MKYRFLRPCFGPAVYRVVQSEDVGEKVAQGGEFNVALELEVYQQRIARRQEELLVGRCGIVFHCTPKDVLREREARRKAREEKRRALARAARDADDGAAPR